MYQEDAFAQRLMAAFDEVLAPIFTAMDCFDVYLDPWLAPEDFLDWLGGWVGLAPDGTWPADRRRAFVAEASSLHRVRGTARGLAAYLELLTGGQVEILETGGAAWSTQPGTAIPGSPGFGMLVRVHVDDPAALDLKRLDAMVAAAKPAHVEHRVEIVGPPSAGEAAPAPPPQGD
jgi:phage tail-like protein